jgi:hypothetical protein
MLLNVKYIRVIKVNFLVIQTLPQLCCNWSQFVQNSLFGTNWDRVGAELRHKLVSKKLTLKHANIILLLSFYDNVVFYKSWQKGIF